MQSALKHYANYDLFIHSTQACFKVLNFKTVDSCSYFSHNIIKIHILLSFIELFFFLFEKSTAVAVGIREVKKVAYVIKVAAISFSKQHETLLCHGVCTFALTN